MAKVLCAGSMIKCSFGQAPTPLNILPINRVLTGPLPAGNLMDNKPFLNVMPFAMCTTPSNPMVAALTAAAMGVLTPAPCIPALLAPWITPVPTIQVGPAPALNETSKLMCMWGGMISPITAAQATVVSP